MYLLLEIILICLLTCLLNKLLVDYDKSESRLATYLVTNEKNLRFT